MNIEMADADLASMLGIAQPNQPAQPATQTTGSDPLAFLAGIGEEPKSKSGKTYPVLPDPDGTASALAKRTLQLAEAKEQLEANNRLLGDVVVPHFFNLYHGRPDFESSIRVMADDGRSVLVTCQKRTTKLKDPSALDRVRHIIGPKEKDLFYHTFDLKIDGDEIPPASVAPLVTELKALFAKHGANKALKVERQYKPRPAFFTQRHVLFTPEQNMAINEVMPITTAVKTKGVS